MINVSRLSGRWGLVGLLIAVSWLGAGCQTGGSNANSGGSPDPSGTKFASTSPVDSTNHTDASPGSDSIDKLHAGDNVTIEFSDTAVPFPARDERIKEDGTITLMEDKTFTAANKSRGELEKEIHDYYVPNYYLKMTVSVRQQKETQFYYVRGEVKIPGRQVYISRITLLRAIGSAGDFTDFARKTEIHLIRSDKSNTIWNGKKLLKHPELDPEILPGDTVFVPRRSIFH
jgi:polysaccharide export outer membrane protein